MMTIDQMMEHAATLAVRAHANQVRKDGTPYIAHVIRVAIRVEGKLAGIVSLLHDIVEDTYITLENLREMGYSEEVVHAVDALTKRHGESYTDFISRVIEGGKLPIEVKLADIADNTADTSALDPEDKGFLAVRYGKARDRLIHAMADLGFV